MYRTIQFKTTLYHFFTNFIITVFDLSYSNVIFFNGNKLFLFLPFFLIVDKTSWRDSVEFVKILIPIYRLGAVEIEITYDPHAEW